MQSFIFIPNRIALCSKYWFFLLLNYGLFCPNYSYQGHNYQNVPQYFNGNLWPYHLSRFINSVLYHQACKAWLFEKFSFELEAYYSFKITSVLVRQVISLKQNGDVIIKIYCLISWSPIRTPIILLSAIVKMTGTSAITVWEWLTLVNSSYKGKRIRLETIYFSFKLDIGVHNFNHVNEFVSITKLKNIPINLRRAN